MYASLAPFIARKKHESEVAYNAALLMVFRLFGFAAIVLSLATAITAPLLIDFIYGDKYKGADHVLAIHVFSNFFVFQGVAQHFWLVNEKAGRTAFWRVLCGAVVAFVSNLILLPMIGLDGAAFSALLSYGASAVFSNIIFSPKILLMQFGLDPKEVVARGWLKCEWLK